VSIPEWVASLRSRAGITGNANASHAVALCKTTVERKTLRIWPRTIVCCLGRAADPTASHRLGARYRARRDSGAT